MSTPVPRTGPRVSVTSTRAVMAAAERRGVDTEALLARHAVDPAVLADPDARLEASVVHAIWTDATVESGQPELPVLAAVEAPWGAYRVIDYLCSHADHLSGAIELLSQNFGLVNDAVTLSLTPSAGGSFMVLRRPDGGVIPARYVDYALAACVYRMTYIIGADVHPSVRLRRPPPTDVTAHTAAFGPRVAFDQDLDEVFFDAPLWAAPSISPHPGLRSVLRTHAALLQANLVVESTFLAQLRTEVEAGLPFGRTELSKVARSMHTSARTLQRRLAERNLTWRAFLAPIQDELAKSYLQDRTLSVAEVACMVGYSDSTSFSRAFVRNNGQTPGAWRSTH